MDSIPIRRLAPIRWIPALLVAPCLALGGGEVPAASAGADIPPPPEVSVEAEEDVYSYQPPDNGSGAMWCHGSTCIVRTEGGVFASGIETISGAKPLHNVRWTLWRRDDSGWKPWRKDEVDRTREPSPLAAFPDGRLFLSVNPTLAGPDSYSGPAEPRILELSSRDTAGAIQPLVPVWAGKPAFTEHSYRSFAADGPSRELILLQNIGYTHAEWAFLDRDGRWSASGKLGWPFGNEYAKPEPVRVCYPTVALRDRQVHFCGVSDIIEPNPEWRAFKKQLTGRDWDYDFRRLFYTWTDEIGRKDFEPWVEVSSRDRTCGWIFPCDLWLSPDGAVHLLWSERAIDERLRERFFPSEKQRIALEYAVLRRGSVTLRRPIAEWREGVPGETPGNGRFQATEDGRLFAIYYVGGSTATGQQVAENRIVEIRPEGTIGKAARVPLAKPFPSFFTATPRAGTPPTRTIDLLGEPVSGTIRYARVRIGG